MKKAECDSHGEQIKLKACPITESLLGNLIKTPFVLIFGIIWIAWTAIKNVANLVRDMMKNLVMSLLRIPCSDIQCKVCGPPQVEILQEQIVSVARRVVEEADMKD